MADVNSNTVNYWWTQTKDYNWEALRQSLDVTYQNNSISPSLYQSLRTAVNQLETLGVAFPHSASELISRLDHYV